MKLRIPPPKSTNRVVLLLGFVCLLATFTGVILVGAHSDDNTSAATDQVTAAQQNAAAQARIAEQFGQLPLSFEINKGQIDEPVKFLSHGAGYDLFLTATEAVLRVQKPPAQQTDKSKPPSTAAEAAVREGTVLRLRMLGRERHTASGRSRGATRQNPLHHRERSREVAPQYSDL